MKLLMLPRYSRSGASSRLRTYQYRPVMETHGFEIEVQPLFDDAYLERLYCGRSTLVSAFSAVLKRFRRRLRDPKADVIWLEKEALPWMPWPIEKLLLRGSTSLVVDYDDAVFHRYDKHRSRAVRLLLGNKIDRVMASANLVVAGNQYLADRAIAAGADRVEIVPTVVDDDAYRVDASGRGGPPVIGWIGTPGTWKEFVEPRLGMLFSLAQSTEARVLAVGALPGERIEEIIHYLPWNESDEIGLIQRMDIGIMPLDDTPWARGKCGYKLIQYMACGLPVIASPVGVNAEIVEHGVNGFLARTDEEWRAELTTLLNDPALRRRMGQAGRRKVEAEYSLQVWAPRVADLLRSVVERRNQ